MEDIWYHGSPFELETIRKGSTITQDRNLARVFSHKPTLVSIADDGTIQHNGTLPGFLYRVTGTIGPDDIVPHPRSSMEARKEWLTCRELRLEQIGPTCIIPQEILTETEIQQLQQIHNHPHG